MNLVDYQGYTALHMAVGYEREEIVKLLLQRSDLDLEVVSKDGAMALDFAEPGSDMEELLQEAIWSRQN